MRHFLSIHDIPNLSKALGDAFDVKKNPFAYSKLGINKTILLIFFNSSLRTRLSTQKAAMNLGMNVMVLDINQGAWKLESKFGVVMDGDKVEHILEAIPVMGAYCDIIGIRSFAQLNNKEEDYNQDIINQFVKLSGRPIVSLESACGHPLQAFTDVFTIEEYKKKKQPKVVLSWAPHPKALPQAVANSFAQWCLAANYQLIITHPKGYELESTYTNGAKIEYEQDKAFEGADFIYAKNWSACQDENYGKILTTDISWRVDEHKMSLTNNAYFMHCLPVRRNMIVSDNVIDSKESIVIEQAANRLVCAQTILKEILISNCI